MKKKRLIFILAIIAIMASTAISFAANSTTTSVTVTGSTNKMDATAVTVAADRPSWSPTVNRAGEITQGELFQIDATGNASTEIIASLYVTNPDDLAKAYSYLNMTIAVYYEDTTDPLAPVWKELTTSDTALLSLSNGYVTLKLTGREKYRIGVKEGSYYALNTSVAANLAPQFTIDLR